jgi:hypothetical protein
MGAAQVADGSPALWGVRHCSWTTTESEGRRIPGCSFNGCRRLKLLQIAALDETRPGPSACSTCSAWKGPEILPCRRSETDLGPRLGQLFSAGCALSRSGALPCLL